MIKAERDAATAAALDRIANGLADVLIRRHQVQSPAQRVTTMEALMEETQEWLYTPGVPELRKIIAKERKEREALLQERERERTLLLRLAQAVIPDLDGERAASLSLDELQALVEEHT